MIRRNICLGVLLCVATTVCCQSVTDTVRLETVAVFPKRIPFNEGAKREAIDSLAIKNSFSNNLAELLSRSSSAIIKSYGTEGMSSAISLRGGGGTRTQIMWEGIPLNANSNGETNLSLVPVSGFNQIAIDYSASATNFGSGTFGGAVEMNSVPAWENKISASVLSSFGSFNTWRNTADYSVGNRHVQYSGSLFFSKSDGNFPYFDYIRQENLRRKNADHKKYGTIQNLHVRVSNHVFLQGSLWYLANDSHLPAIMGSDPNNAERQTDSSFKSVIAIKLLYPRTQITARTAFTNDYELYTKKLTPAAERYSTYSEIINKNLWQTVHIRQRISPAFSAETNIVGNIASANVGDYGGKKQEKSLAGVVSLAYSKTNVSAKISCRKEWNTDYSIPLIFNTGIDCTLLPQKLAVRATAGNKYRTPTFNDLYWLAWGNPDLKPEHGFSGECGARFIAVAKDSATLDFDVACYHSVINDMIMWTPQGAVWHPNNTSQAVLQGVEYAMNFNLRFKKFSFTNSLKVNWNNAHISRTDNADETAGHQLYYVPKIAAQYTPMISARRWDVALFATYEGKRYYSLKKYLDAYFLLDISVQRTFAFKKSKLAVGGIVRNATGCAYEQVRSYPLPRRSFQAKIQYMFNQ